jgi:LuxR family maltose regulon positive regulatory protein
MSINFLMISKARNQKIINISFKLYNILMLPLLRTKTTIPPTRPRQIERSRLLDRVNEGMHRALTLIIAPAGFGKTTLAAAWASASQVPTAWLSLQPTDRHREHFISYLIQALQSIAPQIGQTSLALMRGGSFDGALFALANDLAEVDSDITLVLDDYHSVDSPEIAEIMQFLLDNRPAVFHILLVTRATPTLIMTRLRALDQVIEINESDLRFTEKEVHLFLETSMELHLSADDVIHLNQTAEGWAVGLQLTALALVREPANWQVLAGQEHIFDYLAQEVLHREPSEIQEFLKITALFDRFCVSLCDYLLSELPALPGFSNISRKIASGSEISRDLISYIERANLFLVPIDSTRTWFRYHALFADFLRSQLPAEQTLPIYHAASDWFEAHGALDDAIHYATHAGDFERAASMLEHHYIDLLKRGEQDALQEWITSMPSEILEKHPRLWLARGWAYAIALDSTQARACAEKAETLVAPDVSGDRLRGEVKSLLILTDIFVGNMAAAEDMSDAFIRLAEQDNFLHSLLHFSLGLYHVMSGDTVQAIDAFSETLRLTQSFNNPLVTIFSQVFLAESRQIRGALGLSERTFQQVIRYAKDTLGEHTFLLGMPYVSYADLLREQNRFDDAIRYAEQGIAYCQIWQPIASIDGEIALARIFAATGRWEEAQNHLERFIPVTEINDTVINNALVAIHLARLALLRNDLIQANHYIKVYDLENSSQKLYFYMGEQIQLVLCRAKIAGFGSDLSPAAQVIETLSFQIKEAERRERVTPVIEALILLAYTQHAILKNEDAVVSLSRAFTLGAQSGYIRIFADEGKRLLHLLEQYRYQIHAPRSYLDQILNLLRREATQPVLPGEHDPALSSNSGTLINLTRREVDILLLLATGKSNQEIAVDRVLTLNTVKKHVANILSKLGVANRTQAVMQARKLGWIE